VVEQQRRYLAMTKETRTENLGTNAELTDNELDSVTGGTSKETKTPPKTGTKAIEIQDYGFGVSMPVTTS
jgi:bacteriocin-like protein